MPQEEIYLKTLILHSTQEDQLLKELLLLINDFLKETPKPILKNKYAETPIILYSSATHKLQEYWTYFEQLKAKLEHKIIER